MLLGSRKTLLGNNHKALWIGNLCIFDSGIYPEKGHVYEFDINFYRHSMATRGMYITGMYGTNSLRADILVWNGELWYMSYFGSTKNTYFTTHPFLIKKVQNVHSVYDTVSKSNHTYYNHVDAGTVTYNADDFSGVDNWPIGARRNCIQWNYTETLLDTGIVNYSLDIDGEPALRLVPWESEGIAVFKNMVDGSIIKPIIGQASIVEDYTKDGIEF